MSDLLSMPTINMLFVKDSTWIIPFVNLHHKYIVFRYQDSTWVIHEINLASKNIVKPNATIFNGQYCSIYEVTTLHGQTTDKSISFLGRYGIYRTIYTLRQMD